MLSSVIPLPALPSYRGQHNVGSAVYEVPIASVFPELASPPVSTIKFRLFYPTSSQRELPESSPWIPEPQDLYIDALLKLGRIGAWLSSFVRSAAWTVKRLKMPVYENASLLKNIPRKVLVYSHGLTCSMNTSSAMLGELASRGFICVAVEHRDGSAPLTVVQTVSSAENIYFRNISFKMRPDVLAKRDEQLKIRVLELQAAYKTVELLNAGTSVGNIDGIQLDFKNGLDLRPGAVSWLGYSFGGASLIQFLKTSFYNDSLSLEVSESLLIQPPSTTLAAQITAESPVTLIDPWYMPLRSEATRDIYNKPLPCHTSQSKAQASTIAILSSESMWTWPQCHSHMPAILSTDPSQVVIESQEVYEKMLHDYPTPEKFMATSKKDLTRRQILLEQLQAVQSDRIAVYVLKDTTHTTFCDYGVVFQWLSYLIKGQKDAISAIDNVVRCILKATGHADQWESMPASLQAADRQLQCM